MKRRDFMATIVAVPSALVYVPTDFEVEEILHLCPLNDCPLAALMRALSEDAQQEVCMDDETNQFTQYLNKAVRDVWRRDT